MSKKGKLEVTFTDFDGLDELAEDIRALLGEAKNIAKDAYAPYSNFKVGATVLLEDGSIVGGSNQENRAFSAGLCAERVAIFSASANKPNLQMKAIGIFAEMDELISPCGSCRQALLEYEEKQQIEIELYLLNKQNEVRKFNSISDLLPFGFKFNKFAH